MITLAELLKEKKRRQKAKEPKAKAARSSKGKTPTTQAEKKAPDFLETWMKKRMEKREFCAGEIANMLDGLTPDGFNKEGVKVSFIERGTTNSGLIGDGEGLFRGLGR